MSDIVTDALAYQTPLVGGLAGISDKYKGIQVRGVILVVLGSDYTLGRHQGEVTLQYSDIMSTGLNSACNPRIVSELKQTA